MIFTHTYIYIYNHCKQSGAQRMAKTFVKGLQKKPQSKQIETLIDRLQKGHQTDGEDHVILANTLNISLVVHHPGDVTETLTDAGPQRPVVHVRLMERWDESGTKQGHFDLLRKRDTTTQPSQFHPTGSTMSSVAHAVSLRGTELAAAILKGYKTVETCLIYIYICICRWEVFSFTHVFFVFGRTVRLVYSKASGLINFGQIEEILDLGLMIVAFKTPYLKSFDLINFCQFEGYTSNSLEETLICPKSRILSKVSGLINFTQTKENRPFALEGQWFCVHVGKGDVPIQVKQHVVALHPDISTASKPKGHIVGMCFCNKSMTLQEYRDSIHCSGACSIPDNWKAGFPKHISSCRANHWAVGPIINFIQHVVEFETPVPCSGNLGKWPS